MGPTRLRSIGLFAALVLAALAVGHHLIYLIAHGDGDEYVRAMSAAGHDAYWANFLVVVGGAAAVTLAVAIHQLRRLASLAGSTPRGAVVRDAGYGRLGRTWLPLFAKVAAGTTIAFLVQENAELLSVGKELPGIGVVTGDHAIAIPVLLLVAAAIALVRALVEWRRDILLARLRGHARPRAGTALLRPVVDIHPLMSAIADGSNGTRAPPVVGAVPI